MARLQGALDQDIYTVVQKLLQDGVSGDSNSLYAAIQRSNSALKRKPKKTLQASIERVLDFLQVEEPDVSADEAEKAQAQSTIDPDSMNRSLRANLMPPTATPASPQRQANGEPAHKRKKINAATTAPPQNLSLDDIGGMDDVLGQLERAVVWPLLFPDEFANLRIKLPSGILLHGPPGCGKTMISRALAAEMGLPFVEILGPSIVSGMSGESEKAIRERFDDAKRIAPCLIYMDEIDAIAPKRDTSQSQMEKRIVAQLLVCMDELQRSTSKPVMVLATTNRPDSIDPALRRGGRFDTEINIGVPNEQIRESILEAQTWGSPLAEDVDFRRLAKMTAGFVGADLQDLVSKAGSWQLERYFRALKAQLDGANGADNEMELDGEAAQRTKHSIRRLVDRRARNDLEQPAGFMTRKLTMEAFLSVLPTITPSSKREGFATVPNVSWNDVGALAEVREELQTQIVEAVKNPEKFAAVGNTAPTGVLLWGPPGCGKTLLAKAVAAESQANFISVKGPELLDKFLGESEASVRRVFARARSSVPCVIFFDELDALVPRRTSSANEVSARVVNTLLTELDDRPGIYIIAATNRPDMIDEALLRPGRLDSSIFVDLPGPEERADILTTLVRSRSMKITTGLKELARECTGFSGADLGSLLRAAGNLAVNRNSRQIDLEDLQAAKGSVTPSVTDIERYRELKKRFGYKGMGGK